MSSSNPLKVRFPLRVKLAFFAALLLIIHIIAVGWAAVELTRSTVETSQKELQIAVLEVVAAQIEHDLRDSQDALDTIGRTLTNEALDEGARIELATTLVESSQVLDNAIIYDGEGKLITPIVEGSLEGFEAPPVLDAALAEEARKSEIATGSASVTSVGARVPIALPIKVEGKVTGYVATMLATTQIQATVESQADAHFTDLPGAVFVIDSELRYLAHPDRELSDTLSSAADEGILEGIEVGTLRTKFSASAEFVDGDGESRVGTIVGRGSRGWALVAQVPRDVAYLPIDKVRRIVLIAIGVALAVAIVASIWLSQRVTSPLSELSNFAGALARRDFKSRVTIDTSDELALLGEAMSRAAADLQQSEDDIRNEHAIRADLGRYLPAELVDKVVRREQDMELGGERREITVMFADVVAFTPLAGRLPPEQVVQILNELFTIVTEIVFRHEGTVDKFIGDCVMAMWGAPREQPDHADRAVRAAEEIVSWLEIGNVNWKKKFGVSVQIAIGINTGEAVVGNVGSRDRMEYTAIGEAVNLAARLEAIARPQQILISTMTKEKLEDSFEMAEIGERQLAGHPKPLTLYELIS